MFKSKKKKTAGHRENTVSKGIDDPSSLKEERCVIMSYQNEECITNVYVHCLSSSFKCLRQNVTT